MTHDERVKYWDRGQEMVPAMTGARGVLDGRDMVDLAQFFGLKLPLGRVLDVGCGTGRMHAYANEYLGADIAPSAVAYCNRRLRPAVLITGPADLPPGPFDIALCLSVFTHIDETERSMYLDALKVRTSTVMADIIPGDGTGSVAKWTANEATFAETVRASGWEFESRSMTKDDGGVMHRYYLLRHGG